MPCEGPVHLRRAVIDDAPGVAAVHVKAWQREHEGHVPADFLECMRAAPREHSWREELGIETADRKPWVAMLDDRIIGVAAGGIARDGDVGPRTGEVYVLSVDRACWERGIRTNLIEHVFRDLRAHGFAQAVYWVIEADEPLRQFAEHMGFHTDGASRFEDCGGTQVAQVRYLHPLVMSGH